MYVFVHLWCFFVSTVAFWFLHVMNVDSVFFSSLSLSPHCGFISFHCYTSMPFAVCAYNVLLSIRIRRKTFTWFLVYSFSSFCVFFLVHQGIQCNQFVSFQNGWSNGTYHCKYQRGDSGQSVFWAMFKSQPQQRLSNFNSYFLPELKKRFRILYKQKHFSSRIFQPNVCNFFMFN